jgi:hypothetical protein
MYGQHHIPCFHEKGMPSSQLLATAGRLRCLNSPQTLGCFVRQESIAPRQSWTGQHKHCSCFTGLQYVQ